MMPQSYKKAARSFEWWLTHRTLSTRSRTSEQSEIDLARVKRILVVRLDEIGDVVLTSPFLRELRANLPGASITLLVKPAIHNLVELCPYLDEIVTYEPPASRYWRSIQATSQAKRLAQRHFDEKDFDLAIVPRWDADSYYASMLTYLSGARARLTYSERVDREKRIVNIGLDRLFTHVLNGSEQRHEVEKNLDLVRFLKGAVKDDRLELWLSKQDEDFALEFLQSNGVGPDDFVITCAPGARLGRRMWPLSKYVEWASWFKRNFPGFIVLLGSENEKHLGEEMHRVLGKRVINAIGMTTLRQAAALLKHGRMFVGNDAGAMHLAAAAGSPVIEISCNSKNGSPCHPNSPARFGPWKVPHRIVQPNVSLNTCVDGCNASRAHCITKVSVAQVKEAFASLCATGVQVV